MKSSRAGATTTIPVPVKSTLALRDLGKDGSQAYVTCCAFVAGATANEQIPNEKLEAQELQHNQQNAPLPSSAGDCLMGPFKEIEEVFEPPIVWDSTGSFALGPISFSDGPGSILDVVIDLDIDHTWMGDLDITVLYDVDCDGSPDASAIIQDPSCSDSSDLGAKYFFTDAAIPTLCDVAAGLGSTEVVPPGCYGIADPLGFSAFRGLSKEGCWVLAVDDGVGGDGGVIRRWSVHLINEEPVAVEGATWGSIKATYQD